MEQWSTTTASNSTVSADTAETTTWRRPEMHRAVVELEAPAEALDDLAAVRQLVEEIVDVFELTLLRYEAVKFEPIGITGFGVIGESHISVHTWPEANYAHVELLTCTELPDAEQLRRDFPLPRENLVEVRRCEP